MIRDRRRRGGATRTFLAIAVVFGLALVAPATSGAYSYFAAASSEGSKAFFITNEQLVSGDTDSFEDVYERSGGATTRVSQGAINGNGDSHAYFQAIASDGSKVFFETDESLVSGDTDGTTDLYERSGGTTIRVSQGVINGNDVANGAFFAGASSDGTKVFFTTAEQLVSGDTDSVDDLYERSGGTTAHVSQGVTNGNGGNDVFFAGASSDGSKVFFYSSEQLVSGDTDSSFDVYERSGGTTTQVSEGVINGDGAFNVFGIAGASSDGSKVFFETNEQLVSGDSDTSRDVYERSGGTTTQVSEGEINGDGAFNVYDFAGASSDGSKVFFITSESLVSGDTDGLLDIYERSGGTTTWVSQGAINGNGGFGVEFDDGFGHPTGAVSSDGSKVIFTTDEQLVSGDTDDDWADIYERSGGTTTWISQGDLAGEGPSDFGAISSDGSRVFFSTADQLVSGDTDGGWDDVYQRLGGTTTWLSQGVINSNTSSNHFFEGASSDGGNVYFRTAEKLVSGDGDGDFDVYERIGGTTNWVSVDQKPPQTTITSGPSGATNDPTPTFTFSSSEPGSTFQCKLDAAAYAACTSPKTLAHLADGAHTFSVRAIDPAGNVDSTPAVRSITVLTAEVKVSGSTLVVTAATGAKDNLVITKPSASVLRVTDFPSGAYTGSGVRTGAGCTRTLDYTANCNSAGITLIQVVSGDQTDKVTNSTAVKSSLNGGAANDVLTGGSVADILIGGPNVDVMKGMNGNDDLRARDLTSDTTINCDGGSTPGGADKADLDLLPKDPNAAVIGCETKTRH